MRADDGNRTRVASLEEFGSWAAGMLKHWSEWISLWPTVPVIPRSGPLSLARLWHGRLLVSGSSNHLHGRSETFAYWSPNALADQMVRRSSAWLAPGPRRGTPLQLERHMRNQTDYPRTHVSPLGTPTEKLSRRQRSHTHSSARICQVWRPCSRWSRTWAAWTTAPMRQGSRLMRRSPLKVVLSRDRRAPGRSPRGTCACPSSTASGRRYGRSG